MTQELYLQQWTGNELASPFTQNYAKINILVLGAHRQLGQAVKAASAANNHYIFSDVNTGDDCDMVNLDITSISALRDVMLREKISVIVNCAAYTNVEKAEDDIENARKLNRDAVNYGWFKFKGSI